MRSFLFVAAILVTITATAAHAQQVTGFVESHNTVSETGITPQLNVYVRGPLDGKLGWSIWTLTSELYSEAYVSLTFAPTKWMEVSSGVGLETADNPFRMGHSLWMGKGRWSFLTIHEHGTDGKSDYWYRYLGTFQMTKTVTVGVDSAQFLGTGPYVEKKFGKVSFSGTYAIGDKKGIAGIKFNF